MNLLERIPHILLWRHSFPGSHLHKSLGRTHSFHPYCNNPGNKAALQSKSIGRLVLSLESREIEKVEEDADKA